MNALTIEVITFSTLAVAAGTLVMVGLVRELAPAARTRWLLSVGLSTGMLAITLKILLMVIFSVFAVPLLDILPEPRRPVAQTPDNLIDTKLFQAQAMASWQALPLVAPAPAGNPQTPAKIALGKALFFEKRLSLDSSLSCASCHELSAVKGGADGRPVSTGIYQQQGDRNAPTVINAAFQRVLFWDGRADSLETQALGPLVNQVEMGMPSLDAVEARLKALPDYSARFAAAFPADPNITVSNLAKAIAAYERTLITPNSAYDRFLRGDLKALSQQQIRGMALFESIGCSRCHAGPNFSEASVFGTTAAYRMFPALANDEYEQQYQFTRDKGLENDNPEAQAGVWRIPSLRNVSRTGPYFHNGSVESLEEAVRIMAAVQLGKISSERETDDRRVYWSGGDKVFRIADDGALSDNEVAEIVAFLQALEGELPGGSVPRN